MYLTNRDISWLGTKIRDIAARLNLVFNRIEALFTDDEVSDDEVSDDDN